MIIELKGLGAGLPADPGDGRLIKKTWSPASVHFQGNDFPVYIVSGLARQSEERESFLP